MTNEKTIPETLRIGDCVTLADVSREARARNAFIIKYIKKTSRIPAGNDPNTEYCYNSVSPDGTGWYRENAVELFNRKE